MKAVNVIVSPSASLAAIVATDVPSELFSFILLNVWLLTTGTTLSVTLTTIGKNALA